MSFSTGFLVRAVCYTMSLVCSSSVEGSCQQAEPAAAEPTAAAAATAAEPTAAAPATATAAASASSPETSELCVIVVQGSLVQFKVFTVACFSRYGIRSLRSSVFDIKQMIWLNFVKNVQM